MFIVGQIGKVSKIIKRHQVALTN